MYANCVASHTCNVPEEEETFAETRLVLQDNVQILRNGHLVSRASDYIIYSVEAATIGKVVAQYGPCA